MENMIRAIQWPVLARIFLAQYHKEFDDKDGIMHDVYFALAKAEWMCCEQSKDILKRVGEIIASQANIPIL